MWNVRLHTIPEDKRDKLLEYCRKARDNDSSFKFTEEDKYVIIECPSRDSAYRRGVLLHSRFGCFFEVEWKKEGKT